MKFLRTITFGALCLAIIYSLVRPRGGPEAGQDAPLFRGQLLSGAPFELGLQKGKVVVLDFWATWCGPCRRSLPALERVYKAYASRDDVVVVSINQDRGRQQATLVKRFMGQYGLSFPVVLDRGNIAAMYRVTTLPTMVLIAPNGVVHDVRVGAQSSDPDRLVRDLQEAITEAR